MLTLFTIFVAVAGAGFAFWFYNRRQIKNLSEQIDDKNAVINAFRNHVEPGVGTEVTIESSITYTDPNTEWRGNSSGTNLTPTVEQAFSKKKTQKPNQKGGQKKQRQDARSEFSSSEKKNRPKPRKPKTQQ